MTKIVPAKKTLKKQRVAECGCGGLIDPTNSAFHHDHLYDYAKDNLQALTGPFKPRWLTLLDNLEYFTIIENGKYLFRSIHVCNSCNSVDSDLKSRNCIGKDWYLGNEKYSSLKAGDLTFLGKIKKEDGLARMKMVAGEKDKSGQSIVSKRINEIKHGKIEIDKMIANVVSPAANVARQGAVQARAVSPALFELRDHGGCVFIWGHESDWWKNLGPELQVANALSEWLDKFKPSSDGGQNC